MCDSSCMSCCSWSSKAVLLAVPPLRPFRSLTACPCTAQERASTATNTPSFINKDVPSLLPAEAVAKMASVCGLLRKTSPAPCTRPACRVSAHQHSIWRPRVHVRFRSVGRCVKSILSARHGRTTQRAGIVGCPNVGKSTLFNSLTRTQVPTYCTGSLCSLVEHL